MVHITELLPAADNATTSSRCCGSEDCNNKVMKGSPQHRCRGCKDILYCSDDCRRKHWNDDSHRLSCPGIIDVNNENDGIIAQKSDNDNDNMKMDDASLTSTTNTVADDPSPSTTSNTTTFDALSAAIASACNPACATAKSTSLQPPLMSTPTTTSNRKTTSTTSLASASAASITTPMSTSSTTASAIANAINRIEISNNNKNNNNGSNNNNNNNTMFGAQYMMKQIAEISSREFINVLKKRNEYENQQQQSQKEEKYSSNLKLSNTVEKIFGIQLLADCQSKEKETAPTKNDDNSMDIEDNDNKLDIVNDNEDNSIMLANKPMGLLIFDVYYEIYQHKMYYVVSSSSQQQQQQVHQNHQRFESDLVKAIINGILPEEFNEWINQLIDDDEYCSSTSRISHDGSNNRKMTSINENCKEYIRRLDTNNNYGSILNSINPYFDEHWEMMARYRTYASSLK